MKIQPKKRNIIIIGAGFLLYIAMFTATGCDPAKTNGTSDKSVSTSSKLTKAVSLNHLRGKESPAGQILIVNANLAETFRQPDVKDPVDMRNFVKRVLKIVPYSYPPDILLLQEVRRASAQNVADFMTEATGFEYDVAVDPGLTPFLGNGHRRETTIVLNMGTMQAMDEGGFQRSKPNRKGRTKDHAYSLAKELRGGLRVAMTSVHYAHHGKTNRWVKNTAAFLENKYPSPAQRQIEVVAGDFNKNRCRGMSSWKEETLSCNMKNWYKSLTQTFGYTDAVFSTGKEDEIVHPGLARIDFIFARGTVIDAGSDLDKPGGGCKKLYNNEAEGSEATGSCKDWYSDHRLYWALVGMGKRGIK